MLRSLCAALAVLMLVPAAYAADKGPYTTSNPPANAEPIDVLSYKGGAYVGVTGGYSAAVFEAETIDFGGQDPFVGVYAGYSGVYKGWMFGIEGDYLLTSIETVAKDGGFSFKADSDYLASIRGRAGITWGPVVFYTTAGVAFMEQTVTFNGAKDSKDLVGFAGGLGVEAEVTKTMTVRLESLHYSFGDEDFTLGNTTLETDVDQTLVRAGLAFKLN